MPCPICNNVSLIEKLKYSKRNENFEDENNYINYNNKILTCLECDFSFNCDASIEGLNKFYSIMDERDEKKKKNFTKNRFEEFNSRFFSQVLYYLQFFKINKNCSILEIGPNRLGISKTIGLFQNLIKYYYFDEATIRHSKNVVKLGNYYYPNKVNLPKLDLIWMSHSLEHIHPSLIIPTIKHFYNALNEDGKIFIEIPDELNPLLKIIIPHTIFFTRKSLFKLFENNGFEVCVYNEIAGSTNNSQSKNNEKKINKNLKIKLFVRKIYLFLQKFLPDKIVKKYIFKNFVKNGPYTNEKLIRLIVKKKVK